MRKDWLLAASLALVLGMIGVVGCSPGSTTIGAVNLQSQQEGIWVTGQGTVMAIPDIVTLSLGVEAQEASVAEAQDKASGAMEEVMTALTDSGVAGEDIQTQYFNIRQITRWDGKEEEEIVVGYQVTNVVTAKIRVIEEVGAIIDAVVEAGGDFTRINSISFSVDDPSDYYAQAREKAVTEAKAKAEQLSELAGVTLGKPTYISEGTLSPIYSHDYMYGIEKAASETPISPGEIEISLTIQVAYATLD